MNTIDNQIDHTQMTNQEIISVYKLKRTFCAIDKWLAYIFIIYFWIYNDYQALFFVMILSYVLIKTTYKNLEFIKKPMENMNNKELMQIYRMKRIFCGIDEWLSYFIWFILWVNCDYFVLFMAMIISITEITMAYKSLDKLEQKLYIKQDWFIWPFIQTDDTLDTVIYNLLLS